MQIIHRERSVLYSFKGTSVRHINHYQRLNLTFKTTSYLNSEMEEELQGEIHLQDTLIEAFKLNENTRIWWKKKNNSWQNHFQCQIVPKQILPFALEKWIEGWIILNMIPFIHYHKGLLIYTIQFKEKVTQEQLCEAMELIEQLCLFIKKARF